MIKIRDFYGSVVARSQNLRGILDYSRDNALERLDVFGPNKQGGGTLGVTWANGATCLADFADHGVLVRWVKARRVFRGVEVKQAEQVTA